MSPERIRRAAEVLRGEAECLRDSHATCYAYGEVVWDFSTPEDHQAKAAHDEMLALAGELDEMADE